MQRSDGWAVAQTYGACERKAVENLLRQDYEAFCPLVSRPSKNDVRRTVETPLFPCYVFVRIAPQQRWLSINSTIGIIRLLTNRDQLNPRPIFVHEDKINEVLCLSRTVEYPMPIGSMVRVRHRNSPLYDLCGTVVGMDKAMRVSVMMSIFNRDVVVEFVNQIELEVVA